LQRKEILCWWLFGFFLKSDDYDGKYERLERQQSFFCDETILYRCISKYQNICHSTKMLEKPQQVAIVGSGLAGLTAARLLADDSQHRYEVHIYEIVRLPPSLKDFFLL